MLKAKWYEDKKLNDLSKKCDEAHLAKDDKLMASLVEECFSQAHDLNNDSLVRARYFYITFTTQSSLVDLKISKNEVENTYASRIENIRLFETDFQKSLYLARNAFGLLNREIEKNNELSKKDFVHIANFKWQLGVNYANFFYQVGRYTRAVEILSIFDIPEHTFPMGSAQLGMKIYELSRCHYDNSQQMILLHKAFQCFKQINENNFEYPEKTEIKEIVKYYNNNITSMLRLEYLKTPYAISDFICHPNGITETESEYRMWVAKSKLSLNILNDVFISVEVAYDPIHLPSMTEDISSNKVNCLFGLFNHIKQEYVSARFLVYQGLNNRDVHFSDKEVYLINTLDYPIYGLGIEKIKMCYRTSYSIFDKIAFFLNEYFDLGIAKNDIGFFRLFSPYKNANDKKKIIDIAKNNYPLLGMWWLFKDIRNINIDEDGKVNPEDRFKYIDEIMSQITKVRNAMEHGYLKVLDSYPKEALIGSSDLDSLAHNISFKDFETLTLQLLKYVREAIILLVFSVNREEELRKNQHNNTIILPMFTDKYDDDWKQIVE